MSRYFIDSSALVKHYHVEAGTPEVDAILSQTGSRGLISRLALVELQSSFARLTRDGVLTAEDFARLGMRVAQDVADGKLIVVALSGLRLDSATSFFGTHGLKYNVRTLDVIHLTTAHAVHQRRPLAGFVAADRRLLSVAAEAYGLTTIAVG